WEGVSLPVPVLASNSWIEGISSSGTLAKELGCDTSSRSHATRTSSVRATHSQSDIDAQRLIDFQLLGFRYGSYSFNKFTSGRVFNLSSARRRRSFFQGLSR